MLGKKVRVANGGEAVMVGMADTSCDCDLGQHQEEAGDEEH